MNNIRSLTQPIVVSLTSVAKEQDLLFACAIVSVEALQKSPEAHKEWLEGSFTKSV